jgi:hypothetical protein
LSTSLYKNENVRCATLVLTVTIAVNGRVRQRIENGIRGKIIFENKSCFWPRHKRRNCLRKEGELKINRDKQSGRLNKEKEMTFMLGGGRRLCPEKRH